MLDSLTNEHGAWLNRAIAVLDQAGAIPTGPNQACHALCLHVVSLYQTALHAVRHDLPGGAWTLLRPSVETWLRAIWLKDDAAAEHTFRNDEKAIPGLFRMFELAEAKFAGNPPLLASLQKHRTRLHGLTHGGKEMLAIYQEGSYANSEEAMRALIGDLRRLAASALLLSGFIGLAPDTLKDLMVILDEAK